jgi:L-threonylcarbamoyladenylate synthase
VPGHPTARALAARLGRPVTAPSANPPAATPPRTLAAARAYFGNHVAAYVDGGELAGGASTVVAVTGDRVQIVRSGHVDEAAIRRALEG